MDALELLTADHNRVRGLFAQFEDAEANADAGALASLTATIREELEVHTTIEEEIFYPAVAGGSEELSDLVDEGVEEHHVVKVLLDEVAGLDAGADQFVAKMKVLIENVEHHAEEEETEMFPKVRSAFEVDRREALGERLDARKGELGAPRLDDREDLSAEELREKAREQQIPGRSTMDAEELAATVDPD
jgi:hemerythrin superfamily protein